MRRLRIERLDLDLRGIDATLARAAARQLGPALERALARRRLAPTTTTRLDAGRLDVAAGADAAALAIGVAERIASKTSRG
jgi:hypothetical protein